MPNPILEMSGISKRFPGVIALEQVNLDIYPNEVVALIGENGAGKSTLMKILDGDRSGIPASKQIFVPTLAIKKEQVDDFAKKINQLRGR